jgi:hypothetical protein
MTKHVHTIKVTVFQEKRPLRTAVFEGLGHTARYGVHGPIKEYYGVEPEEELPTTLDNVVAALGA